MNITKQTLCIISFSLIHLALHASDAIADAYYNLGQAFGQNGDITQAQHNYNCALERCPDHVQSITQLGMVHFEQKQYAQACIYLEKRVAHSPNDEEACIMLGHCYMSQHKYECAIQLYTHTLSLNPRRIDLFFYRAQCNKKQYKFECALADIEHFLTSFPEDYPACMLKSHALEQLGKYEDALNTLDTLPQSPNVLIAKAHIFKTIGQPNAAIDLYTQVRIAQPSNRSYLLGLSYSYLLAGDIKNGYTTMKEYIINNTNRGRLLDDISNINGNRILIGAEILLDNMIQHIRYARSIKQHGGTTIVQAPEPLIDILSSCDFIDEIISTTQNTIPAYDYHIPAILLPWLFENDVDNRVPYLTADQALTTQWQSRLPHNDYPNIGICWDLNELLQSPAEKRPIATECLNPLFELNGYNFFALYSKNQQPDLKDLTTSNQLITMCGTGFSEQPHEMQSLLALIDTLDIIITIDTTIAHLAGAMGKKTYLLLPYHTNWHWGLERSNSAWYPTITIIRQSLIGSWQEPIIKLVKLLKTHS